MVNADIPGYLLKQDCGVHVNSGHHCLQSPFVASRDKLWSHLILLSQVIEQAALDKTVSLLENCISQLTMGLFIAGVQSNSKC